MVYIILFASATVLFYVAEHEVNYRRGKTRKYYYLCCYLAIFILALFAGLRATSVGTDVEAYGYRLFLRACEQDGLKNIQDLFNYTISGQSYEFGYVLANFLVSRFTNILNIWLFILSFATLTFVFQALRRYENRFPLWLGMLIYLLLYYNESLNLMRQSLAGAIIIFAFQYIEKRKPVQYLSWIFIAMQFHTGAMVAAVFYFISLILDSKYSFRRQLVLIVISIVALFGLQEIINYLVQIGLLHERYSLYVTGGEFSLYLNGILIRLPIICLLIWKRQWIGKNIPEGKLLMSLFFMEAIFIQAISLSQAAYRLAAYFGYGRILLFPALQVVYDGISSRKKQLLKYGVIIYTIVWWGYYILIGNSNDTLPYIIDITFVRRF